MSEEVTGSVPRFGHEQEEDKADKNAEEGGWWVEGTEEDAYTAMP